MKTKKNVSIAAAGLHFAVFLVPVHAFFFFCRHIRHADVCERNAAWMEPG